MSMPAELLAAHKRSSCHRDRILQSQQCGCFCCLALFPPDRITQWTDFVGEDGTTALCPHCGIDSVLDSTADQPLTEDFLRAMQTHWFNNLKT